MINDKKINAKNNSSHKINFEKVIRIFRKNYKPIPLEVFKDNPYEVLISTLLSSRTRDEITLEASKRLITKAKNLDQLGQLEIRTIEKLIYPVGFYITKSKQLKELAKILSEKYKGKVPNTREELMTLPGVGRKTANLVLNRAFNIPAIAVDTHVHRISNLLGWVKTTDPIKTEIELNKVIPKKYWSEVNRLFVSIGRQYGTGNKLQAFLKLEKLN